LDKLVKLNKYKGGQKQTNWEENFHETRCMLNDYIHSTEDFDALTEKGVYPYSYMTSFAKFDEPQLPPLDDFYNDLAEQDLRDSEYERAHQVWQRFNVKNLGEYHEIYLLNVGLLSEVFENFRNMAMQYYGLDPAHYLTPPPFCMGRHAHVYWGEVRPWKRH
jgi:hypothetical protein